MVKVRSKLEGKSDQIQESSFTSSPPSFAALVPFFFIKHLNDSRTLPYLTLCGSRDHQLTISREQIE